MAEKNVGRPWTEDEDKLLTGAVSFHGEHDNWKTIALLVPGRTNKACRKRWLHSLSPDVKKTIWTSSEDNLLYNAHRLKWSTIARNISGRTDDACSKRYSEALDLKTDEWTADEDNKLLEACAQISGKWGRVGEELQRSGIGCRNRWRHLERKRAAEARILNYEHNSLRSHSMATPDPVRELTLSPQHPLSPHPSLLPSTLPSLQISCQPSLHSSPHSQTSFQSSPSSFELPLSHEHHASLEHYIPYYPPEAYYPSPSDDYPRVVNQFRESSPENVIPISPYGAPFKFSSSSLSAALSDTRRLPSPLPAVRMRSPNSFSGGQCPTLSPLPLQTTVPLTNDEPMSLDDIGEMHEEGDDLSQLPQIYQARNHDTLFTCSPVPSVVIDHGDGDISPITHISDVPFPTHDFRFIDSSWKSDSDLSALFSSSIIENSPNQRLLSMPPTLDIQSDLSSAASTPFDFSYPLTPNSSPSITSPSDLLSATESPGSTSKSLLFSSSQSYSSSPISCSGKVKKTLSRCTKHAIKPRGTTRLSNMLSISSDSTARPYACGRDSCWPLDAFTSAAAFKTSGELLDHSKAVHANESISNKPFRCGLAGCQKSWKSINGLQYHLQISMEHFQNALSSQFSARGSFVGDEPSVCMGEVADPDGDMSETKLVCPRADCFKAYRHASGLRYHIKHGHPEQMPIQLSEVPPALARQLPKKAMRMRRKSPHDTVDS